MTHRGRGGRKKGKKKQEEGRRRQEEAGGESALLPECFESPVVREQTPLHLRA